MLKYTIEIEIAREVEKEWIEWMLNTHIPDVMKTGCFDDSEISKKLESENDKITYYIIYTCPSQDEFQYYLKEHAPELQEEHKAKFLGNYSSRRFLSEVKEEF